MRERGHGRVKGCTDEEEGSHNSQMHDPLLDIFVHIVNGTSDTLTRYYAGIALLFFRRRK